MYVVTHDVLSDILTSFSVIPSHGRRFLSSSLEKNNEITTTTQKRCKWVFEAIKLSIKKEKFRNQCVGVPIFRMADCIDIWIEAGDQFAGDSWKHCNTWSKQCFISIGAN